MLKTSLIFKIIFRKSTATQRFIQLLGVLRPTTCFAQDETLKIAPLPLRHRRVGCIKGWAARQPIYYLLSTTKKIPWD